MTTSELIRLQLRLECKAINAEGLLERIPGPDPDGIARFSVYYHDDTYTTYCRHDLPRAIRERLLALSPIIAFEQPETVETILREHGPIEGRWLGTTFVFPETLAPAAYPDAVELGAADSDLIEQFDPGLARLSRPVFAIVVDGKIVSACVSARENQEAAEAWVQTLPDFRRHGYACQVTAAWAHHLQRLGKQPFYSHIRENLASQAVARRLGLVPVFDAVGYL